MTRDRSRDPSADRLLHGWYASQFSLGICLLAGGFFMLPAYLDSIDATSAQIGLVMSLIGVGALVSPVLGRLADRLGLHRALQNAGVAAAALASIGFAVAKQDLTFATSAILLGLAQAAILSMNASLVMASDCPAPVQARQITALAATFMVGQAFGLLLISAGTAAGASYQSLFLVLAGLAALGLVVTAATNGPATRRLAPGKHAPDLGPGENFPGLADPGLADPGLADPGLADPGLGNAQPGSVSSSTAEAGPQARPEAGDRGRGMATLATSALGAFLLAVLLSQTGQLALETQLPVYMHDVFGISASTVSAALFVAVVLSIFTFIPIGAWTSGHGPSPAWLLAQALRLVGAVALFAVGASLAFDAPAAVPLLCYLVLYLAYPLFNAAAPLLVARVSKIGTGEAQGLYVGALAICGIAGPSLGGWLAGQFGIEVLPMAVAAGGATALGITLFAVRQPGKQRRV